MHPTEIRRSFFPFARPDYITGMLIGDDLDSLLSAAYLQHRFGWPVVGAYCQYKRLWFTGTAARFRQNLLSGRYLAVDLDICHLAVPAIGHHVIRLADEPEPAGHTHTLNPNLLAGRSVKQGFQRKYPLATIHFLLWLFDDQDWAANAAELVWLADSSFINAQQYRENVNDWIQQMMPLQAFIDILPALQTRQFEENLQARLLNNLAENPLCQPALQSAYRSRYLGINGFQCQFNRPDHPALSDLLHRLHQLAGWPLLTLPEQYEGSWAGHRATISVDELMRTGCSLSEWLERNDVFSYAFVFRNQLNYTRSVLQG